MSISALKKQLAEIAAAIKAEQISVDKESVALLDTLKKNADVTALVTDMQAKGVETLQTLKSINGTKFDIIIRIAKPERSKGDIVLQTAETGAYKTVRDGKEIFFASFVDACLYFADNVNKLMASKNRKQSMADNNISVYQKSDGKFIPYVAKS